MLQIIVSYRSVTMEQQSGKKFFNHCWYSGRSRFTFQKFAMLELQVSFQLSFLNGFVIYKLSGQKHSWNIIAHWLNLRYTKLRSR